jgi:hypothetical protein
MLYNRGRYSRLISEIFNQPRRSLTQTRQLDDILQLYELLKHESTASTQSYSKKTNPNGIFPNNELDLQKIKVYGFDFGLSLNSSTKNFNL